MSCTSTSPSPDFGAAAFLALALCFATALGAAAPARAEVDALLERLEQSGCRFNRQGEWFDAKRARAHLERKLTYLERRAALESAEQFIEQVASASSTSGTAYLVQCGGSAAVPSASWLGEQLRMLRELRGERTGGDRLTR